MNKRIINEITFLVTTINKTFEEILFMVKKNGLFGNVIVGCQNSESDYLKRYSDNIMDLHVYFQSTIGVSVNRNFLLNKVATNYCFFFDDDITLMLNAITIIEKAYLKYPDFDFIFFDFNYNDPTKNKVKWKFKRKLSRYRLRSYGTNSVLYNVDFIKKESLLFDEKIGPGCYINSGEDGDFMMRAVKKTKKAYSYKEELIQISYDKGSTWFSGYNEGFFVNIGFSYKKNYGFFAKVLIIYTILKHRGDYLKENKFSFAYKNAVKGVRYFCHEFKK